MLYRNIYGNLFNAKLLVVNGEPCLLNNLDKMIYKNVLVVAIVLMTESDAIKQHFVLNMADILGMSLRLTKS